jgi:uncharacterized protein (TIGR00251 family)
MKDFSPAIRQNGKSTLIDISVTTNADITGITGFDPWRKRITVAVKALPLQNRANFEIVGFFSKLLSTEVRIVSGTKSSKKTLEAAIPVERVKEAFYGDE